MKKQILCLGIILFLLVSFYSINLINFVSASDEGVPGLPSQLEDPEQTIKDIQDKAESSKDYLSNEFKTILLKNPIISSVDSFLTEISIIFRILLGVDYSLSLSFFIILILWIFFFFSFLGFFKYFNGVRSLIFDILVLLILAQLRFFLMLSNFFIWLVFLKKEWYWNIIFSLICIFSMAIVGVLFKNAGKMLEEKKKQKLEDEANQAKKETIAFNEGRKDMEDIGTN